MDISNFFDSYPGMYIAQSFCHSLIAAIIVARSIQAWKITNPVVRQRFSFIVILIPIFSFPLYQIINPERGSIYFRLKALFDINKWLNLELPGNIPLSFIFIFILLLTTIIFFSQEIIPIFRHTIESKKSRFDRKRPDQDSIVNRALESLPVKRPDVFVIDDDALILSSGSGENAGIVLSTRVIDVLNMEQLQAALAHEIAHIERSRRPLILIIFFLRILMFFNPVVLIEFRRIVQEDEKICDDIAVSLTQKPYTLAETLRRLYYTDKDINPIRIKNISALWSALNEYSHNILIEGRILRLEEGLIDTDDRGWLKFIFTFIVIMIINYFVV